MTSLDELDALQATLNEAINAVREEITLNSLPPLSTYATTRHPLDDPTFECPPRLYEAKKLVLASIGQLKLLLQRPYEKVHEDSTGCYVTACLDIGLRAGILGKLMEPAYLESGLHVQKLQELLDLDAVKLTVVLRYLASRGWVYELSEGTFKVTRPALELREGENGWKWAINPGRPELCLSFLPAIVHPEWRYSRLPNQTAFQLTKQTDLTLFQWLKQNPNVMQGWARAVQSVGAAYEAAVVKDGPWSKFASKPWVFVDCGGGKGNLSISLSDILPHSTFVVQELEEVVPIAEETIRLHAKEAAESGRISAEAHDLQDVQPRKGADHVYLLRHVLHNWGEESCVKMLKNITSVAAPGSKVMIIETVSIPSTVSESPISGGTTLNDIKGTRVHRALDPPPYIPGNFGSFAQVSLTLGVHMMGSFNALERSLREWTDLVAKAGLKVVGVHASRGQSSVIECELDN